MRYAACAACLLLRLSISFAQGYVSGQTPCLAPVTAFLPGPLAAAFCNPAPADTASSWSLGCAYAQPYLLEGHAVMAFAFNSPDTRLGRIQAGLLRSGNNWYRRYVAAAGFSRQFGRGSVVGLNAELRTLTVAEGFGNERAAAVQAAWRMVLSRQFHTVAACRIPVMAGVQAPPQIWMAVRAACSSSFQLESAVRLDSASASVSAGVHYMPKPGISIRAGMSFFPFRPGLLLRLRTQGMLILVSIESHQDLGLTPAGGFELGGVKR
ncbi:MAG: hypothetical protein ACKOQY_06430 [Bacteroidota bacterium]